MKKLLLLMSFVLIVTLGYSQITPIKTVRVANATTTFAESISVGNIVVDINTDEVWLCKTATYKDSTLTTAATYFKKISDTGNDNQGISYNTGTHTVELERSATAAIIPLAVDDGATEGLASFAAADFTATAGNIVIDYANGTKATNAVPGFATAAHIGQIETNETDISTLETLASAKIYLGNVGNVATEVFLSSDVTMDNTGAVTIADDAVTYAKVQKVAANNVLLGNDNGITQNAQELTKSDVLTMLNVTDGANVNITMITEKFEENDGTATAHALGHTTVVAYGCRVSLNGNTLDPADYTLTTTTITIGIPVLQYDEVVITYSY